MYHTYAKRLLALLLFALPAGAAFAQNSNKENSPYSRYGIGELTSGVGVALTGMAYTSTAYANPTTINSDNPASYPWLVRTTYEAGMQGDLRTITAGNQSYATGSATLAYLNVAFPLGKHGGLALGLRPVSHVYYDIIDTNRKSQTQVLDSSASEYTGEGGLNYAYIGLAGKIKGFSLGFNFGYLFGTIRSTSRLENLDTTHVDNSDFSKFVKLGGIYWKGGAQYQAALSKKVTLRLGATLTINQDLSASSDDYLSSFHYSSGVEVDDTITHTSDTSGHWRLPMSYSFGAFLTGDNWSVGLDYSAMNWTNYREFGSVDEYVTDNTTRVSIGGEYTPDPSAPYKYLPHVTYRAGFYYGTDYVRINSTDIKYYGFTVGASLPFKRSTDRIHIALEFGKRGTESDNLVKENYFRLHLGISLNDRWFIKRKYD